MKVFTIVLVIILIVISKYMIKGHPMLEAKRFSSSLSSTSSTSSSFASYKNSTDENNLGTIIGNCLIDNEIMKCFKKRIIERLDNAIKDNETWQINENLMIEKNPDWISYDNIGTNDMDNSGTDLDEILTRKLEDLTESRSIRLKITPKSEVEARKKKDKGGFALMGGIALAGMMAQLFMGKIVMVAGVALILSKLALLFSILNALKKGTGSSEHVVYSGGGGGGGHENSWHRSVPRYNDEQYENRYPEDNRL